MEKSRRRDPRALDYGTYRLVDGSDNIVGADAGTSGYHLSLDDIERVLTQN